MADCCDTENNTSIKVTEASRRHLCPVNNKEYQQVPYNTVLQHIRKPWKANLSFQQYYYCSDADCDVVYFGEDDSVINHSELKQAVGTKTSSDESALICYCFDISVVEAVNDRALEKFVIEKTKHKQCACGIQNPSGKCCLRDFKQMYK